MLRKGPTRGIKCLVWDGELGWALHMPDAGSSPRAIHLGTELGFGKLELSMFPSMTSRTLRGSTAHCISNMETQQVTKWEELARPQFSAHSRGAGFFLLWAEPVPRFWRGFQLGWVRSAELREGNLDCLFQGGPEHSTVNEWDSWGSWCMPCRLTLIWKGKFCPWWKEHQSSVSRVPGILWRDPVFKAVHWFIEAHWKYYSGMFGQEVYFSSSISAWYWLTGECTFFKK